MNDPYAWWRAMLAGEAPPIHESEPQCGYFKMRDRRGLNVKKAPIKRPFIAASIFPGSEGLRAELAGREVPIDRLWPYAAKHVISYEDYQFWHANERWPS